MSAQPVEPHPIGHDPEEILARLPERYREHFLADYRAAMEAAMHHTWKWKQLAETLHLWHLRSVAYSAPGYEQARAEAAAGVSGIPAEDVIPGWAELVAQHENRQA
ncbi:DUF6247 family protein [Microbispora bryophytorum]|uniref:DUF6247 family protein n=1 Tax=Microbispora bryophytorum TaxID=1460882 RepID=UPI0033D9C83C